MCQEAKQLNHLGIFPSIGLSALSWKILGDRGSDNEMVRFGERRVSLVYG